jgi:hypothetical protein
VTSVFWKIALGVWVYLFRASASGLRARSATTTLHPASRRRRVKAREIPLPPPVTRAVLPLRSLRDMLKIVRDLYWEFRVNWEAQEEPDDLMYGDFPDIDEGRGLYLADA